MDAVEYYKAGRELDISEHYGGSVILTTYWHCANGIFKVVTCRQRGSHRWACVYLERYYGWRRVYFTREAPTVKEIHFTRYILDRTMEVLTWA